MTKARAPLTFAQAITRIAGLLGWEEAARIADRSQRAVREWSDPDSGVTCSLDQGLRLDLAYLAAGGSGAPIFETYGARLDRDAVTVMADLDALMRSAAETAKETGEAVSAIVMAARPGATARDRERAESEVEDARAALSNSIRQLGALPGETGSAAGRNK